MADKELGIVSTRFRWIYWTLVLVFIVIGIDEALSSRGARFGGGYRSSSSARYSVRTSSSIRTSSGVRYTASSTRVRVRYNTYRPWRSWHSYGSSGYIYGYVFYTRRHSHSSYRDKEPTICHNEYDNYMDNGTNYEWFICPNISNPDNYDSCCGDEDRQYCCKGSLDGIRVFVIIVCIFVFCVFTILAIYCCCCRKTNGKDQPMFQQRFMSKNYSGRGPLPNAHNRPNVTGVSGNATEMAHLVNPPINGPNPTFPQCDQPGYPPMPLGPQPPYPPQPGYQNGCYPPGDPGAYPPNFGTQPGYPASTELPYAVLPGTMDPGMGYPPNSSAASAPPYPTEGVSAPPYPTDGIPAPPYPVDGGPAPPYPPYPAGGNTAPPYPAYPTEGMSIPPYPVYPPDGSSAPPDPSQPTPYGSNYPASPPPSYSSTK